MMVNETITTARALEIVLFCLFWRFIKASTEFKSKFQGIILRSLPLEFRFNKLAIRFFSHTTI